MQLEKFKEVSSDFFNSLERFHQRDLWSNPSKLKEIYNSFDIFNFLMDEYRSSIENIYSASTYHIINKYFESMKDKWVEPFSKNAHIYYNTMNSETKRLLILGLFFEEFFNKNSPLFYNLPSLTDSIWLNQLLKIRYEKSYNTFVEKNSEYVTKFQFPNMFEDDEIDVLFNFKFASSLSKFDPKLVLLGYLLKHITSIVQILKHCMHIQKSKFSGNYNCSFFHVFKSENSKLIEEKFGDHFVYMMLLNGLIGEGKYDNY